MPVNTSSEKGRGFTARLNITRAHYLKKKTIMCMNKLIIINATIFHKKTVK